MGLFSKKICDICGAEIKMLSGKKLSNGNLCKECRKRLSPWFDEYKESTVEDIKNQLNAREENKKQLDSFKTTNAYGEDSCILIDIDAKKFVTLEHTSDTWYGNSKEITSIDQIKDKNPDVIDFSQVRSVEVDTRTNQNEIKKTVNGERVSYEPKRFEYMNNFFVNIELDHPYIKKMTLNLNSNPVAIKCDEPRRVTSYADEIREHLTGYKKRDFGIEYNADYREVNSLKDYVFNGLKMVPDYSYGFKVVQHKNWREIQHYQYYILMGEDIKRILEVDKS